MQIKKISSGYEAKTGFKAEKTVQGLKWNFVSMSLLLACGLLNRTGDYIRPVFIRLIRCVKRQTLQVGQKTLPGGM